MLSSFATLLHTHYMFIFDLHVLSFPKNTLDIYFFLPQWMWQCVVQLMRWQEWWSMWLTLRSWSRRWWWTHSTIRMLTLMCQCSGITHSFLNTSYYIHTCTPYLTLPYLTLPNLTLPYLTLSYITLPCLILPCLALSHFTLPCLALPYLTLPYLTLPYLTLPYLTLPYLTLRGHSVMSQLFMLLLWTNYINIFGLVAWKWGERKI